MQLKRRTLTVAHVAVHRWQTLSEKKSKLDGDGRAFEEIAGDRRGEVA
jgi:hypothetical protein